jgi:hypothetical protein
MMVLGIPTNQSINVQERIHALHQIHPSNQSITYQPLAERTSPAAWRGLLESSDGNGDGLAVGVRDRDADLLHTGLLRCGGGITVKLFFGISKMLVYLN